MGYLLPWAPELNPNKCGWGHSTTNDRANYCPQDVERLLARVAVPVNAARTRQTLLRGFLKASRLATRPD